jgi:hypothetical protein
MAMHRTVKYDDGTFKCTTLDDNGGDAFTVLRHPDNTVEIASAVSKELLMALHGVKKVTPGETVVKSPASTGNSVLVELGTNNSYIFVGSEVLAFNSGDHPVVEYYSPIGNSSPWMRTADGAFLMVAIGNIRITHDELDPDDPWKDLWKGDKIAVELAPRQY